MIPTSNKSFFVRAVVASRWCVRAGRSSVFIAPVAPASSTSQTHHMVSGPELAKGKAAHEEGASVDPKRAATLAACRRDGSALEHASEALRGDREIVLAAVPTSYGRALRFASDELLHDRQFVLDAVRLDGSALQYVPEALRGDKEIVLVAVRQFGFALTHASPALKVDREVVLAAQKENPNLEGPHRRFRGWTPNSQDDFLGLDLDGVVTEGSWATTEYQTVTPTSARGSQPRGLPARPPARKPPPTKKDQYLSAQASPRRSAKEGPRNLCGIAC